MTSRCGWLVAVVLLIGCSAPQDFGAAKAATENFHRQADAAKYGEIYDASTKAMQKTLTRDQNIGFLTRISRKMGKCGETPVTFGGYQKTPSGTFITMRSSRSCENGKLEEQFVWVMIDGVPKLQGYNANNPLLLTD
jgi:hypothetical protein